MTGEFTIDYTPPAWYTQNAAGGTGRAAPLPAAERSAAPRAGPSGGQRFRAPLEPRAAGDADAARRTGGTRRTG